jgi:hypothetical protein
MTDLAAIFDQQSPFEHDVFGYRQDALLEHRPNLVGEPVVEFGTTADVSNESMPNRISAKVTELT